MFRESEKEYFSKKVQFSTLMFFYKQQGNAREVTYMKAVTQSDEGLSETLLRLIDARFGEFRKENPYITNMYINKSENAGSYHRNCSFQVLYNTCKSKGAKPMRYDYNEPYSLPSTISLFYCWLIIIDSNYCY